MPKNRDTLFLVMRYFINRDDEADGHTPIECWPDLEQAESAAASYTQEFLDHRIVTGKQIGRAHV